MSRCIWRTKYKLITSKSLEFPNYSENWNYHVAKQLFFCFHMGCNAFSYVSWIPFISHCERKQSVWEKLLLDNELNESGFPWLPFIINVSCGLHLEEWVDFHHCYNIQNSQQSLSTMNWPHSKLIPVIKLGDFFIFMLITMASAFLEHHDSQETSVRLHNTDMTF